MQFDFGDVLTRAGRIIWRFKVLWVFGILASCGRGGGGGSANFNSGGGGNDFVGPTGEFSGELPEFLRFLQDVPPENFVMVLILFIFAMICLSLILAVVLFFVRTLGRLGLIQGTLFAEAGAEGLGFMQLVNASKPYYWRVFFLNLLIGLVGVAVGLVIGVPIALLIIFTFGIGLICLIPLLLLMIPIGLVIQVIVEQANVAVVVDDLDVFAALQKGWDVVRNDWAPTLVMGLILFFARIITGLVLVVPVFFAMGPLFAGIIGGGISENMNLVWGGAAVFVLCICALMPFLVIIGGMLESYVGSAWTLTYIRLTGHEPKLAELEAEVA